MKPDPTFDDSSPMVRIVPREGADTVVVSFAGMAGKVGGLPVFELMRSTEELDATRVFLCDRRQRWYLDGLTGIGDREQLVEWLAGIRERLGVRRVLFLGGSSGAYAALLFGALAGADHVLAFAPQIQLLRLERTRLPQQLELVHRLVGSDHPWLDLEGVYASASRLPRVDIVTSRWNRMDRWHARHLERFPSVTIRTIPGVRHSIVGRLRDWGILAELIDAAISARDVSLPSPGDRFASARDLLQLASRPYRRYRRSRRQARKAKP